MSDLIALLGALRCALPLDLVAAGRLANQLLAPLTALFQVAMGLLDVPIIGYAFVPLVVVFLVAGAVVAALLMFALWIGSAVVAVIIGASLGPLADLNSVVLTLVHASAGR